MLVMKMPRFMPHCTPCGSWKISRNPDSFRDANLKIAKDAKLMKTPKNDGKRHKYLKKNDTAQDDLFMEELRLIIVLQYMINALISEIL